MFIDERAGMVSVPWYIGDVRDVIARRGIRFKKGKELTDSDCFQVLVHAVKDHDRNQGINLDVLEFWISALFRERIVNFGR